MVVVAVVFVFVLIAVHSASVLGEVLTSPLLLPSS